ncbi:hypothetical protein Cob_v006746 [Colletotrichum orbiculare MAFF 240422]|uniref:Uncharacterized protein n=1 Tax=Colletotrichum orbiculare (strain 104-T / ATCC 96160 / CBS 514.97 / LARS 414 / MAFF 240422) TaxID=1213857 RepID=A0A484FPM6_COLOR|nr:hypothetical protein Cob_v006746 [Colletotrichum orbiculare MAFF 240422]
MEDVREREKGLSEHRAGIQRWMLKGPRPRTAGDGGSYKDDPGKCQQFDLDYLGTSCYLKRECEKQRSDCRHSFLGHCSMRYDGVTLFDSLGDQQLMADDGWDCRQLSAVCCCSPEPSGPLRGLVKDSAPSFSRISAVDRRMDRWRDLGLEL